MKFSLNLQHISGPNRAVNRVCLKLIEESVTLHRLLSQPASVVVMVGIDVAVVVVVVAENLRYTRHWLIS